MVRPWFLVVVLVSSLAGNASGQEITEDKGPTLYGDGGGRLWKWSSGEKTWLTAEGHNLVLGGVSGESAWGWRLEGDRARFFTLALPAVAPLSGTKPNDLAMASPTFGDVTYPAPDYADFVGDRRLLVWGARDRPRYEVWRGTELIAARAWDDGRSVYALALGPAEGWSLAGRTGEGQPWLEVNGSSVPIPEGWRGRLTVAAWVEEAKEETGNESEGEAIPRVVQPWAAGWGAPGSDPPQALIWGPQGWMVPLADTEAITGGTFPVLGAAGAEGALLLAGWQADAGTGALRPWFWNGESAEVPGGLSDGQPVAFSAGGEGGSFLIVRHQSAPWFTKEDGKESLPLEGLEADDRVVAVEAAKASPSTR